MFAGSSIGLAIDLIFFVGGIVVFGIPIFMIAVQIAGILIYGIFTGIVRLFEGFFR